MSTPILIDLPESACIASMVFSLDRKVSLTESPYTFAEQAAKWQGERWRIDFDMPPVVKRDIAEDWIVFGQSLDGRFNRFLVGDPLGKTPRGVATGTPLVNGANQTGKTLITKGWTPNTTGILKKGDYIQLGEDMDAQLNKLAADANSDALGNATLQLIKPLLGAIAPNSAIIVNNARGLFRSADDSFSYSANPGPIWRFSFSAIEVINA